MALQVGELFARLTLNNGAFNRGITSSGSAIGKLGSILKGAAIGVAVLKIGKEMISSAANAEEMQNKFDVVFKGMTEGTEEWAKQFSSSIGRNRNDVKTWLADNQNMFVGMGATREEGAKMSKQIISLGVDLASFNNLQDAEAIEAFSKAIGGESESAKKLGAVLNDNTRAMAQQSLGLQGNFKDLTEVQKMQVRYEAILMQSTDAIGDAERSQESFTGQLKKAQSQVGELTATLGKFLLPIFTALLKLVNRAMPIIENVIVGAFTFIEQVIKDFFGSSEETFGAIKELFSAIFEGDLAGILTNFKDIIANIFGEEIALVLEDMLAVWIGWFLLIKDLFIQFIEFITPWVKDVIRFILSLRPVFIRIVKAVGKMFKAWIGLLKKFITGFQRFWDKFGASITKTFSDIWNGLKEIIRIALDIIVEIFNIFTAIFTGDWEAVWESVKNILSSVWDAIKVVIETVLNTIKNIVRIAWEAVGGFITNPIEEAFRKVEKAVNGIKSFFSKLRLKIPDVQPPRIPSFGTALPTVRRGQSFPAFQSGSIVSRETIARIGERGREAIVPLQGSAGEMFAREFIDRLRNVGGTSFGVGGNIIVNVNGDVRDPEVFAKIISREIERETERKLRARGR